MDSVYPDNNAYDHTYIYFIPNCWFFYLIESLTWCIGSRLSRFSAFFGDEKNEMKEYKLYQKPKAE